MFVIRWILTFEGRETSQSIGRHEDESGTQDHGYVGRDRPVVPYKKDEEMEKEEHKWRKKDECQHYLRP